MTVPEYTTGDRTAVVRPGFVALVGPEVDDDAVRALWDAAGDGVVGALAVLARDGLTGLPPFALVVVTGRRVHVALRGDVEVVLTGDSDQVLHAGEVSTWSERTVDGVAEVSVRVAGVEADGSALPVTDGVVRAAEVWVALSEVELAPVVEPAAVVERSDDAVPPVAAAPAVIDVPALDVPTLDVPTLDAPVVDVPVLDVPVVDVPAVDVPVLEVVEPAEVEPVAAADATPADEAPTEELATDAAVQATTEGEPETAGVWSEPDAVPASDAGSRAGGADDRLRDDPLGDDPLADDPLADDPLGDDTLGDGPGAADLAVVVAAAGGVCV